MDTSFFFENIIIDVNWAKFWVFASFVILNFAYSIFTFYYKNSNKTIFKVIGWILALSLIGFFMYTACANPSVLDFNTYRKFYYSGDLQTSDVFYYGIGHWMHSMGWSFEVYRGILYGFSYLFLWITLSVYKANKNFVLPIFAIFFWYSAAAISRNWLGFSLVLLAMCFLKLKGKKKYFIGLPCFALLIYSAYQFHASCAFFAVFILCFFDFKGKNYVLRIAFVVSAVLLLSLFYDNKLLEKLCSLIPELYNRLYVYHDRTEAKPIFEQWQLFLGVSFYYLLSAGIIYLSRIESAEIYPELEIDYVAGFKKEEDHLDSINKLVYACVCMFVVLPFFSANFNFYRLLRFASIFLVMGLSLVIQKSKLKMLSPFYTIGFFLYIYGTIWLLSYLNVWEVGKESGAWNYMFWLLFV